MTVPQIIRLICNIITILLAIPTIYWLIAASRTNKKTQKLLENELKRRRGLLP